MYMHVRYSAMRIYEYYTDSGIDADIRVSRPEKGRQIISRAAVVGE